MKGLHLISEGNEGTACDLRNFGAVQTYSCVLLAAEDHMSDSMGLGFKL